MFDSGIKAKDLIAQLKSEVDISIHIPNADYILWENSLEQLLYSEFIHEQNKIVIEDPGKSPINIDELDTSKEEAPIRFEDIYSVFAYETDETYGTQLIKSTVTSGAIFPNTFYKLNNNMGYNVDVEPKRIEIVYFVKPVLKTTDENDNIGSGNIMVPIEFIDLVKSKLRGEAYKVANEDAIAAKWINDYNVLLENFKAWINGKQSEFGM